MVLKNVSLSRMDFKKVLKSKPFMFLLFLFLVFFLKFNTLNTPHVRDALEIYIPPALQIKSVSINPYIHVLDHPPLFYEILALSFSIFGLHLWVGHLIIFLSAIVTLYYTYLIGSYLYNPKTGFVAALFLLFTPLFFAQVGMVMLDVFLMMIATATVYYALRKKMISYLITGHFLILTKESGIIIIMSIIFYKLFFEKKNIKELIIYASPVFTFASWLIGNKLAYGWFYTPDYAKLIVVKSFLLVMFHRINQIFITDYKFVLTLFILAYLAKSVRIGSKKFIIPGFISMLSYFLCRYIANILFLIEYVFKIDLVYFLRFNFHDLYPARYSIPFFILTTPLIHELKLKGTLGVLRKKFKNEALLFFLCLFLTILSFSFITGGYQNRYLLMSYPLFFILGSKALTSTIKRDVIYTLVIILILGLFVTKWWVHTDLCDSCEENLDYLSIVGVHKEMAEFIESNYPDSVILTESSQSYELAWPWAGYVNKGIKVSKIEKVYAKGISSYKIPSSNEFDLVYYSVIGVDSKELKEVASLYNLSLIKSIKNDNTIVYLYGKNNIKK